MAKILIVDDNSMMRRGLRRLIEQYPDLVVCGEAVDGEDSVRKAGELIPDLIIMDLNMPLMNGLDASRKIIRAMPHMPILLFTAYLTSQLLTEAERSGIRGAISKDGSGDLGSGISALLRQETFFQPLNY